jgi:hypothetical protein
MTYRVLVEAVGWVATAVFVGSYFFSRAELLVRVQIFGALLWAVYGVLMRAPPVIAANLLVAVAGLWKASQASRSLQEEATRSASTQDP